MTKFEPDMTVCFSGHRHYTGRVEDEARLTAAVEAALAAGYRTFISGMARGFDLAAAEAVVRLGGGSRLVAAIPFEGQTRGWPTEDLERYGALLDAAAEVRVLEGRYSHGCYFRRDDWMVARARRLICWYNAGGRVGGGSVGGGTRYTVRRALAAGLEIVNTFDRGLFDS